MLTLTPDSLLLCFLSHVQQSFIVIIIKGYDLVILPQRKMLTFSSLALQIFWFQTVKGPRSFQQSSSDSTEISLKGSLDTSVQKHFKVCDEPDPACIKGQVFFSELQSCLLRVIYSGKTKFNLIFNLHWNQ